MGKTREIQREEDIAAERKEERYRGGGCYITPYFMDRQAIPKICPLASIYLGIACLSKIKGPYISRPPFPNHVSLCSVRGGLGNIGSFACLET